LTNKKNEEIERKTEELKRKREGLINDLLNNLIADMKAGKDISTYN
jgi:hypothetical protein